MFLCSACRVQRILSIETRFERIIRFFKELSSIIPKISCSVGEMHENRSFLENKALFLQETLMFLCSACRVQRILSIEASFEGITRAFKELTSIIPKMSCSVSEMHENRRFYENKSLFLKEAHIFLCSACRIQRFLSIETSFDGITKVFKELSLIIPKMSWSVGKMHENRRFFENKSLFLKEKHMFLCSACRDL